MADPGDARRSVAWREWRSLVARRSRAGFSATNPTQASTPSSPEYAPRVQSLLSLQSRATMAPISAQHAHAHPPTPLRPITVLEQHFNHLNFAPEPQPHATAQMPTPIPWNTLQHARHIHYADDIVVLLPRTPMPPALLCLIYYDARSHSIHIFLSFLLPPHLL